MSLPLPPAPPMHLYKYVGTAGHHFAIVENLEIRFSQPSSLNDPLDCQPQVIAPRDPQATVDQIIQRNIDRHPGRWSNLQLARARVQLLRSYTTDIDQRLQESADVLRRNLDKDASASTDQRLRDILAGNTALGHVRLARASISARGSLVFA